MPSSGYILIVDDESHIREIFTLMLEKEGHIVTSASDGREAVELLEKDLYDLVITDVKMPHFDGLSLLKKVKEISPETEVIVMTAYASTSAAVEVMKEGAYDYVTKPLRFEEVNRAIDKALKLRALERENIRLRRELVTKTGYGDIVGVSQQIQAVIKLIGQVADTPTHVLITGESGTGKELVARAVHQGSSRREKPFVAINCAAIPETLIESELFGHIKGAFTGAIANKTGLFEAANFGTIFLDEIGELPLSMQAKLLRVIQEKRFRRIGGVKDVDVDARIISASNKDLEQEVRERKFREDLFFRLNVIHIEVPPLRKRRDDIMPLATFFVEKYCRRFSKKPHRFSTEAIEALRKYDYPGNVRELENVVERAIALSSGEVIGVAELPAQIFTQSAGDHVPSAVEIPPEGVDLEKEVDKFERFLIEKAMALTGGKKKKAAELLHLGFRSFRYRLKKFEIDDEEKQ
jgi:two-component system, NtrC family, response regulator PilR